MLNKLVHETRGKCWHEWRRHSDGHCHYFCRNCGQDLQTGSQMKPESGPDYEWDMAACMELWDDNGGVVQLTLDEEWNTGEPVWIAASSVDYSDNDGRAETPQLAIIAAYLKSKGVDLEKETQ